MRSLTSRLTLSYALLVTATIAGVLVLGRIYWQHNFINATDLLNKVEYQEIQSRLDEIGGQDQQALVAAVKAHSELDTALYFFQVDDGRGNVLFRSRNMGSHEFPPTVNGRPQATVKAQGLGYLRVGEFRWNDLDIHIASSLNAAQSLFESYARASILICLGGFVLSLALGYAMSRIAMKPIGNIQKIAQRITASNFEERIPVPDSTDEVARMARLLNEMLDRLQVSYEQVRRFTSEASHEFRTPLSFIRLQAERLLAHPGLPAEERADALSEQMSEIERLNKLIDDLLFLAKSDAGVLPLALREVDLGDFLSDFCEDAALLTEDLGVQFSLDAPKMRDWCFDPVWMRQVLLNLLSNALKVTPRGGSIQLLARAEADVLNLRMTDSGPGVPEEYLSQMFNRFSSTNGFGGQKGNGLGLAICRSIVQLHGGTIEAHNLPDHRGLMVAVSLPRAVAVV